MDSLVSRIIPQRKDDVQVKWSLITLALLGAHAIGAITIESILMWKERSPLANALDGLNGNNFVNFFDCDDDAFKFISLFTYRGLYILSTLFGLWLGWDGILKKNIIQIAGLWSFNLGQALFCIFQFIQSNKIYSSLELRYESELLGSNDPRSHPSFGILLRSLIIVQFSWLLLLSFLSYKLFREFGWSIYRSTGGNKAMERAFTLYHIHILILKFSVFFALLLAILIGVLDGSNLWFKVLVPVIGFPYVTVTAYVGYKAVRYEKTHLIYIFIVMTLIVVAGNLFNIIHGFTSDGWTCQNLLMMMATYGCAEVLIQIMTIIFSMMCMKEFGKGLKIILDESALEKDGYSVPIDKQETTGTLFD